MIKHNFYHDDDYCGMLSLCISYKCSYGVATMVNDIFMAEHMMNLADSNSSVFMKEKIEEKSDDDDD